MQVTSVGGVKLCYSDYTFSQKRAALRGTLFLTMHEAIEISNNI